MKAVQRSSSTCGRHHDPLPYRITLVSKAVLSISAVFCEAVNVVHENMIYLQVAEEREEQKEAGAAPTGAYQDSGGWHKAAKVDRYYLHLFPLYLLRFAEKNSNNLVKISEDFSS